MDSNFDLKLDIYCHQLRETNIDSYGTKKWFSIIKETVMQKNSLQSNKKAINFQLLKTKHLTLQDSSDIVESYDLDSSRTSSGSSSSSSLTNSSFCKSLKLFGQICCRLSVAPYCRTEAVRLERRSWMFICLRLVDWWVRVERKGLSRVYVEDFCKFNFISQLDFFIHWCMPQNPNKEMNRRELLNQPMRVQIAGLPHTVIISLSE